MTERYDVLEDRADYLLRAFEIIQRADAATGEVTWLCDSTARAIRETRKEMKRLLEGDESDGGRS